MKKRLFQTSLLLIILGLMLISPLIEVLGAEYSSASKYDRTYTFDAQYGYYPFSHRLYTSMPPSLHDYYNSKSHFMRGDGDYSKFVTPSVFKSIAENIQNVTGNLPYSDEQFANAVLMLVRQIAYVKSDVKYPAEAIIDNSGDCDVLSLLAASIMKAGGLDVVLLYYKGVSPSHINVGVYLPYTPVYRTWWMTPAGFEYNNKTYWMAECTSLGEWKVGDQPDLLTGAKPQIVSLENCEESSPTRISSSLDSPLVPSAISIALSSENASAEESWRTFTISGSISPAYSEKDVVMYVSRDGSSYNTFRTVSTDEFGNYSFTWNCTSAGTYYIRTSLSGFSNYAGSDSETLTVFKGFYQPLIASETRDYYWGAGLDGAFARANASPLYRISANQRGKEFLQSNLTGTGVLLSGEFIILSNGQNTTISESEKTTTIPEGWQTIIVPGRRGRITIWRNEQTIVSEQTTNQFGFTLQHNGGNNYTASVKVLNDDDSARLTKQLDGNNTAFMNASMSTRENTWYKVAARISEDEITAELYDENDTLLQNIALQDSAMSISESGILMTYDTDVVIAFKNLKAETLDQPTPPIDDNQTPTDELESLAPFIGLTILLAVAVAAIAYVKERKRVTLTQMASS